MERPQIESVEFTSFLANPQNPIRSDLLGSDQLAELARIVATLPIAKRKPPAQRILRRLRQNAIILRLARNEASEEAAHERSILPDSEWLLDNYFVVEDVLREVRKHLPKRFYKELPVVESGEFEGLPRVYAIAICLVAHTDSHLGETQLLQFVQAFQEVSTLSTGELWALPTMLRLALIENLRRLADQMRTARADHRRALEWVRLAGLNQALPPLPERPSDAFLVEWHQAMRDLEEARWLQVHGPDGSLHLEEPAISSPLQTQTADDLNEVLRREHRRQAANQVSVGNCITSLRLLNAVDWSEFFERVSRVEQILRSEPTGVYVRQDFATRDRYRKSVEELAKATRTNESEVAQRVITLAQNGRSDRERHVGYYLIDQGRRSLERDLGCRLRFACMRQRLFTDRPNTIYFGLLTLLTLGLTGTTILLAGAAGVSVPLMVLLGLVVLLPIVEVAIAIVNFTILRLIPPTILSKMDYGGGAPSEFRTVVVIPGMLTRPESVDALCERLELHFLANPDPEFRFALLTDWADSDNEQSADDLILVDLAVARIRRLNEQHGRGQDIFFLFHRNRKFNSVEGIWMGWERKRGKLEEFNRLLRGAKDTTYLVETGNASALNAKYVLTLDADTVLPRDAARRLVATLAHPLNRAEISKDGRRVINGFGLLQPRVSFLYKSGLRSHFARIFAGSAGIDPYSSASSDIYQDLFGSGTFTGKGLYDIDAFHATAGHAFPENRILSHDLIESNFARCALVTDVEVFDEFPAKYHAYAKREHRWIRGDWQLLPWLGLRAPTPFGRKRNVQSLLGRWKIADNLRRSLAPVWLLAILALSWTVLPGASWIWSLFVVGVLAVPLLLQFLDLGIALLTGGSPRVIWRGARQNLPTTFLQVGLSAVFLANQAGIAIDAIARTLFRLFISHRRLLEWETASATESRLGVSLAFFLRSMWRALAIAAFLFLLVAFVSLDKLPIASLWIGLWILSPVVAWIVSQPLKDPEPALTDFEAMELQRTARKTWRFFETFVTAEDNWLPPDNFQEVPKRVVAHRTSPTNKGLLLLSTLSAHDLGFISLKPLCSRIQKTFDTLERLQRYRGHFFNWYETTTLRPLPPEYVSTVDSGNLLGCLLALKNGLQSKLDETVPSATASMGLRTAVDLATLALTGEPVRVLRQHIETAPRDLLGWEAWLEHALKLTQNVPHGDEESTYWLEAARRLICEFREELNALCPWLTELRAVAFSEKQLPKELHDTLNTPLSLRDLSTVSIRVRVQLLELGFNTLAEAVEQTRAAEYCSRLQEIAANSNRLADEMDFRFLYNEGRNLFSIGYNHSIERLDAAHYDLLASEAALTCFLAVARGVVPRKHWFQLGRLVMQTGSLQGLISWGGSMFEYLMPRLLLNAPRGTMLEVAQRAAVRRQIEYGKQCKLPWGVSESGFYVLSPEGDYQYQSFGVPGLGLKRGLAQDRVVAPYATLLATMIDSAAAVENMGSLRNLGAEGECGFYEAVDFTPDRLPRGENHRVVQSYMAHHQGMALCAITNRLLQDVHCRRLHSEPAVKAIDLLLQERVPVDAPEVLSADDDNESSVSAAASREVSRRLTTADTPAPRAHLLSNGQYTVMLTNSGAGFSICRGLAVTRWRSDAVQDGYGSFIYFKDLDTSMVWSVGHQPVGVLADDYEAVFSVDKATIKRRDGNIETQMEVAVAPDNDVEVRRVTLVNHDTQPKSIELTSYVEIVLNDPNADLAHPAFGKLFLETEWIPQHSTLLCRRRPRSAEQKPLFAIHSVANAETEGAAVTYETDRSRFTGRRGNLRSPRSMSEPLSNTTGAVLDPVLSLRKSVVVPAGGTAIVTFVTGIGETREDALHLANHYSASGAAERAFDLAWAHSRVELRHLAITAAESHLFQRLAGHILFPPSTLRALTCLRDNQQGQSALWRFGISGDIPILAITLSDGHGLPLAKQALKAHAFWRGRGFRVDLLLLADRPASYREELFLDLASLARQSDSRDLMDKPGGIFVRKVQPGSDDRQVLLGSARIVLHGDRGSLADQTDVLARGRVLPARLNPSRPVEATEQTQQSIDGLAFFNGVGGFTGDGKEYVITGLPPMPWSNVLANPLVGCLVTDSGLGFTWVANSQANRLTTWSNDPVSDPPSELVYLRDEETGEYWSPTPLPLGAGAAVWHGMGYTSYAITKAELTVELTTFVCLDDPVKIVRLRTSNHGDRTRNLSATYFAELVLGMSREQTFPFIVTDIHPESGVILARCAYSGEYSGAIAFVDTSVRPRTYTGDRFEFLGRNRTIENPACLERAGLSNHVGAGLDPCAAVMGKFEVGAKSVVEVVFVLGQSADLPTAVALAEKYRDPGVAASTLEEVKRSWEMRLGTLQVRTPEPALDLLVNYWLPYQTLSCRVWGRSAFYQSGGAFGFRDQLQDVMALLYAEPNEARKHILRAAARQFEQGDVQHWWHPPSGRGVRTRFSDDFLWLPYAVARYTEVTGDFTLLSETAPYLRSAPLGPDEHERYELPEVSDVVETIYEHCCRALEHGWRLGSHDIPLMGCGDWNDGMNLVGAQGKGESVWVAWFQIVVRSGFASLAERQEDVASADRLREQAIQLRQAVERYAWDGEWYLRAWFDDGTPLGSHENAECKIDSLPQSWAVFGQGDESRSRKAISSAMKHLVDRQSRLVKLFEPPFDRGVLEPGYIKGYLPGIRENGGQYTHAAIWLVQALAQLGRDQAAVDLWMMLCPLTHSTSSAEVERYRSEPYVIAADVYGVEPHAGRGGWTWYTGSASWMYRAALESLLGFTKRGNRLSFDPHCSANEWKSFTLEYRFGSATYECNVDFVDSEQCETIVLSDGIRMPDGIVQLTDDSRKHSVQVHVRRPKK